MKKDLTAKEVIEINKTWVKAHGKEGLIDKINGMPESAKVQGTPGGCQVKPCGPNEIFSTVTCSCVTDIG